MEGIKKRFLRIGKAQQLNKVLVGASANHFALRMVAKTHRGHEHHVRAVEHIEKRPGLMRFFVGGSPPSA